MQVQHLFIKNSLTWAILVSIGKTQTAVTNIFLNCITFINLTFRMLQKFIERRHSPVFTPSGWDSFTPLKYKINLVRTLAYCCIRICSSPWLLQLALDDLKHVSRGSCYLMATLWELLNITQWCHCETSMYKQLREKKFLSFCLS